MKDTVTYNEGDLIEVLGTGLTGTIKARRWDTVYWVHLNREPNVYARSLLALHVSQFRHAPQQSLL